MDYTRLRYLFEQYESDKASEAELNELFVLIGKESEKEALLAYFEKSMQEAVPDAFADVEKWRPVIERIVAPPPETPALRRINRWWRYAAAAVIIILGGIAVFYIPADKKAVPAVADSKVSDPRDVAAPATTNAYVTLADGRRIMLDSISNGQLLQQGNSQLIKLADGKIAYEGTGGEVVYNTLSNPRGSKVVNLVLADGSTVWLNAASSITYPTAFVGGERVVEITGEAYFEVANKKGKMPFMVKKGDMQVRVLGTHFNVNAYDNESNIKVTLLEGSVQVGSANIKRPEILRPGQQAEVYPDEKLRVIDKVDTSRTMAWKNGYFDFNNADLPVMMRQLERWYDISVTYKGQIPRIVFKGQMDRNVRLADVIRFLTAFGINTNLEGRTLTVSGS
ncbi:MAG: FecR family protein [Pseudobacter sp.]|uniref:FecR family protein n=1 Tax=Pseudobacter sp. TaxID=2045420 RepID=UPI003F8072FA